MPTHGHATHRAKSRAPTRTHAPSAAHHAPHTRSEREQRKQRLLTHGTSSTTSSIADALVLKNGDLFFLTTRDGSVPFAGAHGFGLYYHDCRFLDGYALRVSGIEPNSLVATAVRGYTAFVELTNPDMPGRGGSQIKKETIGITWARVIDGHALTLRDRIVFENFGRDDAEFDITLAFRSRFDDIFVVRGMVPKRTGKAEAPVWEHGVLSLVYHGADNVYRSTSIHCDPRPNATQNTEARFHLHLRSHERKELRLAIVIAESPDRTAVGPHPHREPTLDQVEHALSQSTHRWLSRHTQVESDSLLLRHLINRSLRDLDMLRTKLDRDEFFAAGIPWFVTLFGRDSIITSLQMLMFDRTIAEQTLRILAKYQGKRVDAWREEQPGKILHELRVGELARAGEVPYTPYYGTIDATPLFVILLAEHAAWSGSLRVFEELRGHVERALEWIADYGDPTGDGYLAYQSTSKDGLANQGWKDSGDAIINANGTFATPPIALVEVQGYVWLAKRRIAELFRRAGDTDRAAHLEQEADALRTRFNHDFWMPDKKCYALALQKDKLPAAVISSNPGQALWTGIVDADKAEPTMHRLMANDMFSGWGIRTLATTEARYNPIGYHLGTVWPHDNSLIAAGFRRYGFDKPVQKIFTAISQAAMRFEHYRLPELFGGFSRDRFSVPVRYPVADHPQAWASGSIPYLLQTLLGLVPEAFEKQLRIVRPLLPESADRLVLRDLHVGEATVDLRFERTSRGVAVDVLRTEGKLAVLVEPEGTLDGDGAGPR